MLSNLKMFPIDPRDLIGQLEPGNVVTCQANSLVETDPPGVGALFRWSLGSPFLRSYATIFLTKSYHIQKF